jgi:hypothetical protein
LLPSTLKKRKKFKQTQKFKFMMSHVYKGHIVFEYFLKGKKKFSELQKGFF